ncbi:type I pantothenate kinase [Leuconostoc suionicum]|uniref:type I pantothenate kinase n=1 Tax=Leuconostoc suionicum TaxID=1511761 RepID=UPI0021AAC5EA|nr:type I pantothenate kinase [Leuconostoc suionicum]MCT4382209.1 type I pantothenate kinase [Leuconostoc suionicum]MDC2806123.1 type I pantothenate kinase [Leuconostoc suionicum]MDC2816695.1 type I pantothenate kinase [Leuconostoc suionicum]MDC2823635.1 type I pantothenate kinase [Leuconostoc suionicum]
MIDLVSFIEGRYVAPFMVIGITGSVAVGKSTFARNLAEKLSRHGLKSTVISTDDFLMSNEELHARGLFEQKGFPQTYHIDQLEQVIKQFHAGEKSVDIPIYTQELADIHPNETQTVELPNILIIEGVTALQLPAEQLDLKIYIDANLADIKKWYLTRTLEVTALAKDDPSSWRYNYAKMPLDEFTKLAMQVWQTTNQKNLDDYILPTKTFADVIVYVNQQHDIFDIELK